MGTLTENYHIIKELGRGGMGAVYLANDKRLDRKVAVKMLQLNGNFSLEQKSEIISRFQKEARAIAKLSHPNIVNIHDIGEENDQYYMVMEFLEGKSIGSLLESEGPLPIEECVNISIQICRALDYIHKNSIVHRDIKPDNIIVGSDKVAKITDFGIAQNDSEQLRLTQDGAILGSIMYISPEQLRNSKDVDNRADIFSYGVTLYQMLTGQLPFNGDTVGEVVAKVLSDNPELPRKINPSIPYELEAIVMKAITKDRNKRYSSMEDMERDLQNLASTHSFKKSTIIANNLNSPNKDLNKTINSKTIYNNTNIADTVKSKAVIIEKSDTNTKLLRTVFKIVSAIVLIHVGYSFICDMITPSIASDMALTKLSGGMIQGPYSQSIVEKAVSLKAAVYSLLIVIVMLIFSAYSFPIDSKGIHRNFNIKSEILPALLVLILSTVYMFGFVAKVDTNKKYVKAYQSDINAEIADIESILSQKGILSYSEIDNYKKKYRNIITSGTEKQGRYDRPETQLKNIITKGDHIILNVSSVAQTSDPMMQVASDLLNSIFTINQPAKELYEPKVNQLLNSVSGGKLPVLPEDAKYNVIKDPTNKVTKVVFDWEKNNFEITPSQLKLKLEEEAFVYPPPTDKTVKFDISNNTDKKMFVLLYLGSGELKDKYIIEPNKNTEVSVREATDYTIVALPSDKTALPMSNTLTFNDGDKINIDKIYYQTEDYYSLKEKSFPQKTDIEVKKIALKEENNFGTDDADIALYNLTAKKN